MERAKEKEQPMYVGVDMVKAARWERICEKFPSRLEKMFTEEERAHCESKGKNKAYSYAALWAAREAAGKALGIGIFGSGFGDAYRHGQSGGRLFSTCRGILKSGRRNWGLRICPFPFPMKTVCLLPLL